MSQDNALIIRRFADEVITRGKLEEAQQLVWRDVMQQVQCPARVPDSTVWKTFFATCVPGVPSTAVPSPWVGSTIS